MNRNNKHPPPLGNNKLLVINSEKIISGTPFKTGFTLFFSGQGSQIFLLNIENLVPQKNVAYFIARRFISAIPTLAEKCVPQYLARVGISMCNFKNCKVNAASEGRCNTYCSHVDESR